MVFVKVRETYDLHTTKNKMTVIGIHTPKPNIIKANYPGLLMQCRAYRPVSADVRIACASVQPLDPLGVGTSEGDVAPEDVFNPILYKAISNKGMSQLEARITQLVLSGNAQLDVDGSSASIDVDSTTTVSDEFGIYYGLLSNTHDWKHANPQSGLSMSGLRPLVYEMVYNVGDTSGTSGSYAYPDGTGAAQTSNITGIIGKAKEMPFINCTAYSIVHSPAYANFESAGFPKITEGGDTPANCEVIVPWINVVCGAIIIPPSRLHELFYRMVVEWTIEFSALRPIGEITDWSGLSSLGNATHYQNYSYSATKEALTGTDETILEKDSCMVSANVDINKVM